MHRRYLLIIILFVFQSVSGSPIGFEYLSGHLRTFNDNPMGDDEANIWHNNDAGYLQIYNGVNISVALNRSLMLNMSYGIGYNSPGGRRNNLVRNSINNYNFTIYSDNATVWRYFISKFFNESGREFNLGLRRRQHVNDTTMENDFIFQSDDFTLNRNLYFIWSFELLDIDTVEMCLANGTCYFDGEHDNITHLFMTRNSDGLGHNIQLLEGDTVNYTSNHVTIYSNIGTLINFSGAIINNFEWIDYAEESGDINSDNFNELTGYITKQVAIGTTYSALNNTIYKTGREIIGFATEYHTGFSHYNLSGLFSDNVRPTVNITWSGMEFSPSSCLATSPSTWRTRIRHGTLEVAGDDGGLWASGGNPGDFLDGQDGALINWNDEGCGNSPCYKVVTMSDSTNRNLTQAIQNGSEWFFLATEDESLFRAGQTWSCTFYTGSRNEYFINWTASGYCNGSYLPPGDFYINETVHCINETFYVDGSLIISSTGYLNSHTSNITVWEDFQIGYLGRYFGRNSYIFSNP